LWLFGTRLTRQFAVKAERISGLQHELDERYMRLDKSCDSTDRRCLSKEIDERELEINALSQEQEKIGKAMFNTHQMLEACATIESRNDGDLSAGAPPCDLVARDRASVVEYAEVGDFEQAAILTAAGRVYPMIHDPEAENARDRFLDAILWHSGVQPLTFAPLSAEEKRRGLDALARFALEKVERAEREALAAGALRLQDLQIDGEAIALLSTAVGRPITFGRSNLQAPPALKEISP
jgi:hypothetical protein